MKRRTSLQKARPVRLKSPSFVRLTVTIPRELFPFFEQQRKRPAYGGNRSALVRDLLIEKMKRVKAKAA